MIYKEKCANKNHFHQIFPNILREILTFLWQAKCMCAGFDFTFVNEANISVPTFYTQIATLLSTLVDDVVAVSGVI